MPKPHFYDQVYAITRAIPYGKVLNYGAVADLLDRPNAARAVGYALNALKTSSINDVPWYRVVGKNGQYGKISLPGFTFAMDEQIARLEAEGVHFNENKQFPLKDYLWQPEPGEISAILSALYGET